MAKSSQPKGASWENLFQKCLFPSNYVFMLLRTQKSWKNGHRQRTLLGSRGSQKARGPSLKAAERGGPQVC